MNEKQSYVLKDACNYNNKNIYIADYEYIYIIILNYEFNTKKIYTYISFCDERTYNKK